MAPFDPADATPTPTKDFRALRTSGEAAGASRSIGGAICAARDVVARGLIRVGATPNHLTIAGFLFTCAAGASLAAGASAQVPYFAFSEGPANWWPVLAGIFLLLAGASDMLDGAVARVGGLSTRSGAILDSAVDRLSDMAIFIGCLIHFALLQPSNLTYQILAVVALCNAVLISYIKARTENLIDDCSVGYWLRGERFAAVLIGCGTGHVPAVIWQLAVSSAFTVWRRLQYAVQTVQAIDAKRPLPPRGPAPKWWGRLQLWRHPRGSIAYDFVTGAHIAFIIAAPLWVPALRVAGPWSDPLRMWLGA